MKVLLVNNLYPPTVVGGAEISTANLVRSLIRIGLDVPVATLCPRGAAQTKKIGGVSVHVLPLHNIYWPFGSSSRVHLKPLWHALDIFNPYMMHDLVHLLDEERPDIVHTNNLAGFSVAVWMAARRRGIPVVHTLRDYYLLCPRSTMFRNCRNCTSICTLCRLFSWPRQWMSRLPTAVVGNSRFILDRHLNLGYFRDTEIKTSIYSQSEFSVSADLNSLKVDEVLRFGYLGRLHPSKGIEFLLTVLLQLPHYAWRIVVAGSGDPSYENEMSSRFDHQNIEFTGWVAPKDFFSRIDALVVPSLWHDPLPRVVFEAYARGVPVIASRRGGIPEIVEDGVTGLLFEPTDESSLIRALERFIDDRQSFENMRAACLGKSREFLPYVIANKYLHIYQTLLDSPSISGRARI